MIAGIDFGPTFADFCLLDEAGRVRTHQVRTPAHEPLAAIRQGLAELEVGAGATVIVATPVAAQTLVARSGARTALVTTEGLGDVLEIGRRSRPRPYVLHPTTPPPLVPAKWRFELGKEGTAAPKPQAIDGLVHHILAQEIEAVAVCCLQPAHERQIAQRLVALGGDQAPAVTLSSDLSPVDGEYERLTTTALNAYLAPILQHSLADLEGEMGIGQLHVMQANGGTIPARDAPDVAAGTLGAGPVAGVLGAFELAQQAGLDQILSLDMGGTATDVALCPGHLPETRARTWAGLDLYLPAIDVQTIAAGGGTIAHLDAGGALRVGPEGAGAGPGPLCHGRADAQQVTLTDANLVLGRLDTERFSAGQLVLDVTRARSGLQALARRLSLPLEATAWGIVRVANANLERATRRLAAEGGRQLADFALVAHGGAGPLHACELAAALGIRQVLIPPHPGVLSAWGLIQADAARDYAQPVMLPATEADTGTLERLFAPLYERARADLQAEGDIKLLPSVEMCYAGQSRPLTIPFTTHDPGIVDRFHEAHRRHFAHACEFEAVEIVNLRLRAIGARARPRVSGPAAGGLDPKAAHAGYKQVYFADDDQPGAARPVPTALYQRQQLAAGNMVVGPAIIFQADTTTVIPPDWSATVDKAGNLLARGGRP